MRSKIGDMQRDPKIKNKAYLSIYDGKYTAGD